MAAGLIRRRGSGTAGGFTMIELMIAISLAVALGFAVFYMYTSSMDSYATAEEELRFLQGFRTSTDFVEREVNSMVWKGGYLPSSGGGGLKRVDDGIFRTHFSDHCMVFYVSLDGVHIDRAAYYFNPPEPQLTWNNDEDDDMDDPDPFIDASDPRKGLLLLYDDMGSFMRRQWRDHVSEKVQLHYSDYVADYMNELPSFVGGQLSYDLGDIMADGFSDVSFFYVFTRPGDSKLFYADHWPFADPGSTDTTKDGTGLKWGGVALSYLTVPLGIQIDFHYELDGSDRVLSKLMLIYSSKWQELQSLASGS
jgi:type II secretory pathway pseudopilin PulG